MLTQVWLQQSLTLPGTYLHQKENNFARDVACNDDVKISLDHSKNA
jgi:hypothetical protein